MTTDPKTTNTTKEDLLGTAPMTSLLFKMALPTVCAQLVNLLYSLVDRVFIGHIPEIGKDALAGVGVTTSVIIFISAFAAIVYGGGSPLASIALGRGERDRAKKILGNGFLLLLIFTVVCMVFTYLFMEPLLSIVGASDVTLPYAMSYLRIYLIGTISVMIATGLGSFISVQGRPGIAMTSVLVGAILNTVLDPILIFGLEMGVKGAALATILSQTVSAIIVLSFLFSNKASLPLRHPYMVPEKDTIVPILQLGISPFVMTSTESLVGFVLNGTLKQFGDIYVSALAIMQSAMQIMAVPVQGFSQGITPVISYNYGHANKKRIVEAMRVVFPVIVLFNFLVTMLMILFPRVVASFFTNDPVLIDVVGQYMPLFLAGMTIFGLQRTCQNMFLSFGEAGISLFIALLRKIILLIPLVLILSRFMGVTGVFAGEAIADATAAILCTLLFLIRIRKIFAKMEARN